MDRYRPTSARCSVAPRRCGDSAQASQLATSLVAGSIELRVPLTSPRRAGRFGVKAFVDAATAWNAGENFGEQRFLVGAGGGVFLGAGLFTVVLDAGRSEGRTRLHFGLGMSF